MLHVQNKKFLCTKYCLISKVLELSTGKMIKIARVMTDVHIELDLNWIITVVERT